MVNHLLARTGAKRTSNVVALTKGVLIINLYEISFSFLSPYKVVGTIQATSEEEAKTKLIEGMMENNPELGEITIESIELVVPEGSLILEEPMGHA